MLLANKAIDIINQQNNSNSGLDYGHNHDKLKKDNEIEEKSKNEFLKKK